MRRKLILVLILTVLVSLSIVRFIHINEKYPNPMIIETGIGEECVCFNTKIEIISGTFLTYEDLDEKSILRGETSPDMKILQVRIRLHAKENTRIPLFRMAAQNGLMKNNPMYLMMLELYEGTSIEMKTGEEKEVVLFYSFDRNVYYRKDWDNMENRKWTVEIVDTYPYRYLMEIPL